MSKAQYIGFLKTPPLWENKQFDIQQFEFPQLELAAFQPKTIPGNLRLGHRMEHVFQHLVEYSEAFDIVLHSLQIGTREKTVGEIDFILKDKVKNQLIHVELTYKFYLINPDLSEPMHQLIGPNKRDTFFAKMQKIKHIQFPLLHSVAGAKALADRNLDHLEIEQQASFKAQLFQPYGIDKINIGILNTACLAGYWLQFEDFINKPEFAKAQFYMPTKSEWVIEPNDQVIWKSHMEMTKDITLRLSKENAPLIWMKNRNAKFEKMFVVWW